MKKIIFLLIVTICNLNLIAQKKCKYKMDKYDDFTNELVVITNPNDFGFNTIGLNADCTLEVMSEVTVSKTDTNFYVFISILKKSLDKKENPYKIYKDDKCILILSNQEKITLQAYKAEIGTNIPKTDARGGLMEYSCSIHGAYQLSKEIVNKLRTTDVIKCRIEVNAGQEWLQKLNIDVDVKKTESSLFKVPDSQSLMFQLNCLFSRINLK